VLGAVAILVAGVALALLPAAIPAPPGGAGQSNLPLAAGSDDPPPAVRVPPERGPAGPTPTATPEPPPPAGPPNIVLVVMDDFSTELLRTMPNAVAMQQQSATYDNAFVVNSLCCPSRAATFTGLPPHLNGVLSNTSGGPLGALGGYPAFEDNDDAARSYNVSLQEAGYRTGFVGKYLNEYEPPRTSLGSRIAPPLIEGWDDFESVSGGAYQGWGFYRTSIEGDGEDAALTLREYPRPDRDLESRRKVDKTYAGTVIAERALRLLRRYEKRDKPFLLHVAPYGTHGRTAPSYPGEPIFPPALRDRPSEKSPDGNCGAVPCTELSVADLPGYADPSADNVPFRIDEAGTVSLAESWRTEPFRLTEEQGSRWYRERAQMAQSIDRMIGQIGASVDDNTYLIVTSDNGFHLGQHSLNGGKGLPYDSDSRVPLVVAGPGVVPGRREQVVSNIDLASTIEALAGAEPSGERAGRSFAETLGTPTAPGGRYVFMEHTYGPVLPGEPDADLGSGGRLDIIPSYVAVRGEEGLLVRVDLDRTFYGDDFAWELYRYDRPWEDVNVFDSDHDLPYARELRRRLEAWVDCAPKRCARLSR
jgi:arylsulfatase A-like enzyme